MDLNTVSWIFSRVSINSEIIQNQIDKQLKIIYKMVCLQVTIAVVFVAFARWYIWYFMDKHKFVKTFTSKVLHFILRKSSEGISIFAIKEFIKLGADLNSVDENNFTLLHHAAFSGHYEVTKLLLENGVDGINAIGFQNATPLFSAAIAINGPNLDLIEKLIKEGASITSRTEGGLTILHYAVGHGLISLCQLAIAYGADLNSATDLSDLKLTPLHWAVGTYDLEIIQILLQNGANPSAKDIDGDSVIEHALDKNLELVKTILHEQ